MPDGYYIAVAPNQTVAVNPVLYPKLPFDVNRDLTGITMMGRVPMVLVVSPAKVQATTVAELIAQAKANPDKLSAMHRPAPAARSTWRPKSSSP
jgi:tripartite-type tricarboxylate transporter receptor subunit TctC